VGRLQHGFDCRPDLVAIDNNVSPQNYIGKFWIDSLVHDPNMLDFVVNQFGANRVALGSDYPFPLGENVPGDLIRSMKWDDAKKEMLLSGAALEWLNMEKKEFL
jgi:aminocarboxymuconate-semialdehyde decarboxylase